MKYIIMAGGHYEWFTTPRQFIEVNGEKIIERTIRLLRECGVEDISISTNNVSAFSYLGLPILSDDNNKYSVYHDWDMFAKKGQSGYWVDALYPMDEPCTYIMGDVWYTKPVIETIVNTQATDILFFGTKAPYAPGYYKDCEEPLAFKIVDQKKLKEAQSKCKKLYDLGKTRRNPIAWELYRVMDDIDINTHKFGKRFVGIHDFAIDVDHVEEVKQLEEAVATYGYK